jgi:hypothetical protein
MKDHPQIFKIVVNWQDHQSISKAEQQKSWAENRGYKLTRTTPGFNVQTLIYEKQ